MVHCASGDTGSSERSGMAVETTNTARNCQESARRIQSAAPEAKVSSTVVDDDGLVKCQIQLDGANEMRLIFFISEPYSEDSPEYQEHMETKKEFRDSVAVEGSRFVASDRGGTCFVNIAGYLGKLQLRWSGAASEDACQVRLSPAPLQAGHKDITDTFSFP